MTETLEQIREWYRYMMTSAVRTGGETDRCLRRMTVLFARIDDLEAELQKHGGKARYAMLKADLRDALDRAEKAEAEQADLASPPETVEELRERAKKLGIDAGLGADDLHCRDTFAEGLGYDVEVSAKTEVQSCRVAWFAIVGMEVGR